MTAQSMIRPCSRACGVTFDLRHHLDHRCDPPAAAVYAQYSGLEHCEPCRVAYPPGFRHECHPTGTVWWSIDGNGSW